jgi:hypothetical protein
LSYFSGQQLTQRVVSGNLTEVFRVFAQLQGRSGYYSKDHGALTPVMEAFSQNGSSKVLETISQSDLSLPGFNSQASIQPVFFRKR